ncbi:SpaH/EbpB family LPXTG-anchored major pilin [Butyrivibrio sp. INlla16]|uniref:SpaH/EbpB family LPXTG-anchored major pilin n=1 Tax=Butyrivibrio sp. INlla16 TaxID=1520807 RepID=UPI0008876298|nr:SpaH/EbpB family LPXTG-anchored major pilin [Butyrivibrio sp. INlla16]SDB03116.1 LPXTG-motif cell wall anchor domain-containing protein/fimbrial isopeptide formation D2 domain-containing protein [Butyrivibrio sp. INlla16]
MKGLKKILTGILAGAMALTMTVSAGSATTAKAAGEGSITIEKASEGQEYNVWRVFDYVPAGSDLTKGVYKLSAKFSGFKSSYFSVGDGDILDTSKLATEADAIAFGQEVIAYAKNGQTEVAKFRVAPEVTKTADANGTLKVTGLDYGYYVLDSSLGSAVSLNTSTPNAKLEEKTEVPSVDKKITGLTKNGTTQKTVLDTTGNNAQIGDTVEFTVTADLKKGGVNYKIVDTLTEGLTLNKNESDFSVTFAPAKDGGEAVAVEYKLDAATDNGFEMSFAEPSADVKAIVTYSAVVNTNAKISEDVNKNTVYLKYGNTNTPIVETITKTYPLVLKKVIAGTETVLAGAKFKIYRADTGLQVKLTKVSDTEYKVDPNGSDADSVIVTVETTPIMIKGLDAANYILEETEAPAGYNLITSEAGGKQHAKMVTVTEQSTVKAPTTETIENSTGSLLPSTGGIGTTIFYIIGGLLIVAAVVFFVVRRKADAE